MAELSNEDLVEYLKNFSSNQGADIYKMILDSEIVKKAFAAPESKLILSSVADTIKSNILAAITICADNEPKKAAELIYPKCFEIHYAFKLLAQWGKQINKIPKEIENG